MNSKERKWSLLEIEKAMSIGTEEVVLTLYEFRSLLDMAETLLKSREEIENYEKTYGITHYNINEALEKLITSINK